jgi:pyridoxine/pyridoxamine 5'-phosphate oxidase
MPDPIAQIQSWMADASRAGVIDPTAMAVATV